jgi:hypothetical protein
MKRMKRMSRHRMRIVNRHIIRDAYAGGVASIHFVTKSGIIRFHDVKDSEVDIIREVVTKLEAERNVSYLFHVNPKRWASDTTVLIIIPVYDSFHHEGDEKFEVTIPSLSQGGTSR